MATTNVETNVCTFQWKVENITRCFWLKMRGDIASPAFVTDTLEGTKWTLRLYPMGDDEEDFVSFYLRREEDCSGPDVVEVEYHLAFLGKNGSFLAQETQSRYFKKNEFWGASDFEEARKVFVDEREAFLPEDTLSVQCTISSNKNTTVKAKHLYARTVLSVNRRSFVWRIDKFSSLKPGLNNQLKVAFLEFFFVLNEEQGFGERIIINFKSFDERMKYFSFKTLIIDSDGKKENCGMHEYFIGDLQERVLSSPLFFPEKWMEHNSRYFPDDILTLDCEYAYLIEINQYEFFGSAAISPKSTKEDVRIPERHDGGKEKCQNTPALIEDLKSMYGDGIFSDMNLRTSTKTFPAHKCILSARSPVFKRMFSNEMTEKSSGHVEITDLEEDTVHRMLLYIYTDSLEDLQLESASKLYEAADKYEIMPLKSKCCSFLKDILSSTTVCDVLILADQHQDKDLESAVRAYILEHDEVFSSLEWKHFMGTNIKLAADIMYWKVVVNPVKIYPCNA
ncbi:Speckle-type POZ protein-like B [Araneus ventricosus]|uniref:Speckle-type POZ protein-like B n=1 Tax=Araneus ventricosus TaxID=182803 RepID=A0A4Y2FZQ3_ARAVE|nr:Speckle-type POZ protein-like B [Araneus ventricosus]